jgi:biotin synthase
MGAAWRGLEGKNRGFERILDMVREVRAMDLEGSFDKIPSEG